MMRLPDSNPTIPHASDSTAAKPRALAHVLYRTRKMTQMLNWYSRAFCATVQHQNPAMAFLTFDDEHHRLAFVDLEVIDPGGADNSENQWTGIDHLAWSYATLDDLFATYQRCKTNGIDPYWCVHHGLTISMYYADPDGNQMEFQVNAFEDVDKCNAYIRGRTFAANPVGVEFDPEQWLAAVAQGASLEDFRIRTVHEPVSPIRGAISELMD